MKRKMIGSANGAKTTLTGATPSRTASVGPRSAVTDSGSASVIQSTIIKQSTAASLCAATGSVGAGHRMMTRKRNGPAMSPKVRRCRLKRSSAGE